jgi:hypothetical protein
MRNLWTVTATSLNFRETPDGKIITALPTGRAVNKLAVDTPPWWKVSAVINGKVEEGFVSSKYLVKPPNRIAAIGWFKDQFGAKIEAAITGTPFSLDMLTAIAMQETYLVWGKLYKAKNLTEVLYLCVGDTGPDRKAFPKDKAALVSVKDGNAMFAIARKALEDVGVHLKYLKKAADSSPDKFCCGYGLFQYDLQFFKTDPDYFLNKKWDDFDLCLEKCVTELKAALKRAYGSSKTTLTDTERVYVAIAYNRGSFNLRGGFRLQARL